MDKYLFGKGGSSDPRVRFRVLETDMKCASTVKRKTLNPVWRECFAFALEASDGAATLRVECEDHDDLSSADAMGTVDIDIAPARFQRRRQWHKLSVAQTSKKKPRGDDASMPPNELLFALVRGRNLIIADANLFSKGGSSDPHVSFSVRGAEVKVTSTVQKKTLNPVWRETFSIPLDYDSVSDDAQLDVRCEDWDELSSADFMG
ncbi:C2 domain-containing protein, partial [Pelagophyceae sp. CCMP2097]